MLGEGTSALVALTSDANFEEIKRSFYWTRARLVEIEADADVEQRLREILGP